MANTIFLLDNFDSFTYNLVDQFRSLGCDVRIYRNSMPAAQIYAQIAACPNDPVLVLSPGPGAPHEAGCMLELIGLCRGQKHCCRCGQNIYHLFHNFESFRNLTSLSN